MSDTLPVHELFSTFQGEGCNMGKPAFFIRTFGCPLKCPFCDSAGTWHPKYVPKDIKRMTVAELVKAAEANYMVVITGGEPTIHNLKPLVGALQHQAKKVCIETSGKFPLGATFDWVTLSPKRWGPPTSENVVLADEFKFIIERPDDINFYTQMLVDLAGGWDLRQITIPIWLHPEWSHRSDWNVLNAITEAVKKADFPYRAGWQLHKLYKSDELSGNARPAVPLGGDPLYNF